MSRAEITPKGRQKMRKNPFHSIKFKFFAAISAVALVFITGISCLNLFFYDDYYLSTREHALTEIYRELSAAGIDKVDDMFANGAQGIVKMLGSVNSLDDEDRKSMTDFLTGILAGTVQGAMVDAVTPVAKQAAVAMGEAAQSARANAAKAIEEFRAQQHERAARRRADRKQ